MPSARTRLVLKTAVFTLLVAAVLGAAAGFALYRSGLYNVGATTQHFQAVYSLLERAMRYSVQYHARTVATPRLGEPAQVLRGAGLYSEHCAQCHGGPGTAPAPHGMSMQPVPGPLVDAGARWKPRELYWITRHGIKMSGMPAWEVRLNEADTWAVVAFLAQLPGLDAGAYREMSKVRPAPGAQDLPLPASPRAVSAHGQLLRGDAGRGKRVLAQYACQSCHHIPGITGSDVNVGRTLDDLAKRRIIAGVLPNGQDRLIRWIRDPQAIDPHTAMPNMGVTERDALDISAYLLSK